MTQEYCTQPRCWTNVKTTGDHYHTPTNSRNTECMKTSWGKKSYSMTRVSYARGKSEQRTHEWSSQ